MIDQWPIYAGDSLRLPAQYLDEDGQPKSVTGVLISASVQILTETKACAIQVKDGAAGTYDIYAAASATADWPRGVWPLTVTYEWLLAGEAQKKTEQVGLIAIRSKQ